MGCRCFWDSDTDNYAQDIFMNVSTCILINISMGERNGSVVECRTPEREVGVLSLPLPCCVLEQETLLPESTGNTQEAVALPDMTKNC